MPCSRRLTLLALAALVAGLLAGCGLDVASPDLFLLTRTGGSGPALSMLVNDGGTIRCNGGKAKPLSNALLIDARDLAADLDKDVTSKLRFRARPNTVYSYAVRLQDGTLRFPDTAASGHPDLGRAEQFTLQAARDACGLNV